MNEPTRAVFLDRDGVINHDREDYIRFHDQFRYFDTTPEAFSLLGHLGLPVVVITNQSGIGRGYTTEEIVETIHVRLRRDAASWGGPIAAIEYCPHSPEDGECRCRKPGPGMFERAARALTLTLEGSYMIGDSPSDIEAGRRLGMVTLRVGTDLETDTSGPEPDWRVANLRDAVHKIGELEGVELP